MVLKTAPSRVQCVFLPCGVRARPPLVFSGTQKLHPLVLSVFFFVFFFPAGRIHEARVSEKQKKECPYERALIETLVPVSHGITTQRMAAFYKPFEQGD